MRKLSLKRRAAAAVLVLIALMGALAIATAPVLAREDAAPARQWGDTWLEKLYERLVDAAAAQAKSLGKAQEVIAKMQEYVTKLAAQGQDVSKIKATLEDYKAAIPKAEALLKEAQAILAAHDGFDKDGKVTDMAKAMETIRKAGMKLMEARRVLWESTFRLRGDFFDWRSARLPWLLATPTAKP